MELEQEVMEAPEAEETEAVEAPVEAVETDIGDGAPDDMGLVVELGGEEQQEDEPIGMRNLRNRVKELTAENKALKSAIPVKQDNELPPEPTLEDYDFDEAAFRAGYKEWVKKADAYEAEQNEIKAKQAEFDQRWQNRLSNYEEGKFKLGAPDYDDAEAVVTEILSRPLFGVRLADARLGIIKNVAADPNAVVYALGKNEAKAKELAEIDDVTAFAYAVGKLEAKMTIVRGGSKPAPEKKIGNTAAGVGATDDTLERLRAKAAETGDYTEVMRYKKANGLK